MYPLLRNHTPQYVAVRIFEVSDHITPKVDVSGETITVAKNGGVFGVSAATLSAHMGGGSYWLTIPAADVDIGSGQVMWRIESTDADDAFAQIWVRRFGNEHIYTLIESQRGGHTGVEKMFYWDPIGGDDGNDGLTLDAAKLTFSSVYALTVANRHDVVIILPGQPGAQTLITEAITLNKEYTFLRAPGRDVLFNPSGSGVPTILVSAVGIELSGILVRTFTSGTDSAIKIVEDFCKLHNVWVDYARGSGIEIEGSDYNILNNVRVKQAGQGGAYPGLMIDGSATNAQNNRIFNSKFSGNAGNGVTLKGANSESNVFHDCEILGNGGWGVEEEAGSDYTIIRACTFNGNASGDASLAGANSKAENIGDISTEAATKVWNMDIADGTFPAGKIGYWFYKLKQYFLNRRDAGVSTPGEETIMKDDDVTPSMSGATKKASGAGWNPPTEGVAIRERMT